MIIEYNENSCMSENNDTEVTIYCFLPKDHDEEFHIAKQDRATIAWPVKNYELHKIAR